MLNNSCVVHFGVWFNIIHDIRHGTWPETRL